MFIQFFLFFLLIFDIYKYTRKYIYIKYFKFQLKRYLNILTTNILSLFIPKKLKKLKIFSFFFFFFIFNVK